MRALLTDDIADAGALPSPAAVRDDRAAVDKAISLLLSFGDQASTGLGVSELARRADLSKSTAYRVLGLLERNGVLERVGRRYRLGARLHELGRNVYSPQFDWVRDALIPSLTELYEGTHETVHVAALHGTEVVYLAKLYGYRSASSPSRIGGRAPAYCTAVGKAMLAHDPQALATLLSGELLPFTPRTLTSPDDLVRHLTLVRANGVAYDDEEIRPGLRCVAVPVLRPGGRPVAALGVTMGAGRGDLVKVESVLRRVAVGANHAVARAAAMRRTRIA